MQFGPSLDKRKLRGLVADTPWNGFIELNRMAFSERLPRNSESRALAIAFRLMRKHYPHLQWVVSFADAAQSGDGTIYRAAGFVLTGIKRNDQIWISPSGERFARFSLTDQSSLQQQQSARRVVSRKTVTKGQHILAVDGAASMRPYVEAGWAPIEGYQLRYVYFLDRAAAARLTVPVIPFARIDEMGAGMYRGEARAKQATEALPVSGGGAAPTRALQ